MARIRSVKPELCTSETMALVSAEAERTFVRLWTHCDDEGRAKDHPKLLKASLFPLHDDVTTEDVDRHLAELASHGLIVRYSVGGERFLSVPSWSEHQKPQKKQTSKLPGPNEADDQPEQEQSRSTTRLLPERYGPVVEGRGVVVGEVEVVGDGEVPALISGPPHALDAEPSLDDDQQMRKTAALVGRTIAESRPEVANPAGYATSTTATILAGDDPTDRDRIRTLLRAGESPEGIAAGWLSSRRPAAPIADEAAALAAAEAARRREEESARTLAAIRETPERLSLAEVRSITRGQEASA